MTIEIATNRRIAEKSVVLSSFSSSSMYFRPITEIAKSNGIVKKKVLEKYILNNASIPKENNKIISFESLGRLINSLYHALHFPAKRTNENAMNKNNVYT